MYVVIKDRKPICGFIDLWKAFKRLHYLSTDLSGSTYYIDELINGKLEPISVSLYSPTLEESKNA